MSRLRVPTDYRPATAREMRMTATNDDQLAHNRRLGWMLHIADRHALVLHTASIDARSALCRALLPDLFGDHDPAAYVADMGDHDIAMGMIDDPVLPPISIELPWRDQTALIAVPDATLPEAELRLANLGLKVIRP